MMKLRKILIALLLILTACGTNTSKLNLSDDTAYAIAFLEAINNKDYDTLKALINQDTLISYSGLYEEHLGNIADENSHINSIINQATTFEDIIECDDSFMNNTVCLYANTSNYLFREVWKEVPTTKTKYEFIIENGKISLIYANPNIEETNIEEKYSQAQVGIEITYSVDNEFIKITHVYAGTPALLLGLSVDDEIIAIDNIPINEMHQEFNEANLRLLGQADSVVSLSVRKNGSDEVNTLRLTRYPLDSYIFEDNQYY